MTAVVSSPKHYRNDSPEMDFSPRPSASSVNVDAEELLAAANSSPLSPLASASPSSSPMSGNCQKLSYGQTGSSRGSRFSRSGRAGGRPSFTQTVREQIELSAIALVLSAFKRTGLTCQTGPDDIKMDISWPTNVQHVTHVTFDRFNGFLGLPVEFEMEVPRRAPSASASVFGVSAESMQCSYDKRGNSVPTILLLLQERLYDQDGLKAEGIFRINAENSQEECVRDQLNRGIVPHDIDVHCLAGLIKAWFRELPKGVLDSLSPEQVMECHTEEQCLGLVKKLPPTQRALLNWATNLMADVVEMEQFNKMNARNIAMVFAPNMTQMSDPLTALMHAVQVMNLLKSLILRTLKDREGASCVVASDNSPPRHGKYKASEQRDSTGRDNNVYIVANDRYNAEATKEKETSFEEYESAHDSEEMLLREASTTYTTDEEKFSSESQDHLSNGCSTTNSAHFESSGFSTCDHEKDVGSKVLDGPSPTSSMSFEQLSGGLYRKDKAKASSQKARRKAFRKCSGCESLPLNTKAKGGNIGGKLNHRSERIKAW